MLCKNGNVNKLLLLLLLLLELVLGYHHPQTSKNSEFAAFLAASKLPYIFYDKTVRPCMWTCIRELSFRTRETTTIV